VGWERRAEVVEEVGEDHRRIDADPFVGLGERHELGVLRGAEVGDHQGETRMTGE